MRRESRLAVLLVVLLVFVLGAATLAEGERTRVSVDQGVLIGNFRCTAFAGAPGAIETQMSFKGTAAILGSQLDVHNNSRPAELPNVSEVCAVPATRALELVERVGCTHSPVSADSRPPDFEYRSFDFVCFGELSDLMTALGQLSRGTVAETLVAGS
jgi:hypothetical protein